VLYSFAGGSDGNGPHAGLVDVGGTLYGTTVWGGAYATTYGEHGGTIFSVTRGGKEKILHSFGSGTDGTAPYASLIDVNGTLYGTTLAGGTSGNGTVFALSIKQ
jgi:uncharacterized repeat protein (TIGR03803 family)